MMRFHTGITFLSTITFIFQMARRKWKKIVFLRIPATDSTDITASDPLLTQNAKKAGRAGRKQWKIRRANGGKKHKSDRKSVV